MDAIQCVDCQEAIENETAKCAGCKKPIHQECLMAKRCEKCHEEKKEARRLANLAGAKVWREKNRERIQEYRDKNKDAMRAWRESNRAKILEHQKKYREENREKIRERQRELSKTPEYKEMKKAYRKKVNYGPDRKYREANREKIREYQRQYREKINAKTLTSGRAEAPPVFQEIPIRTEAVRDLKEALAECGVLVDVKTRL